MQCCLWSTRRGHVREGTKKTHPRGTQKTIPELRHHMSRSMKSHKSESFLIIHNLSSVLRSNCEMSHCNSQRQVRRCVEKTVVTTHNQETYHLVQRDLVQIELTSPPEFPAVLQFDCRTRDDSLHHPILATKFASQPCILKTESGKLKMEQRIEL